MRALREFQYWDRDEQRSVTIQPGEAVDVNRLAGNRCDLDKLERTKFVTRDDVVQTKTPRETLKVKRRKREG